MMNQCDSEWNGGAAVHHTVYGDGSAGATAEVEVENRNCLQFGDFFYSKVLL